MENRRRSTRLSGAPDQELVGLELKRKRLKAASKSNVKQQQGQQQQGQAAPTQAHTNSTDRGAGRSARGNQQPEQPLETFISIIETYFGPQSDAELVAAAEGVAEIWHLHDSNVRAMLSDVLGPLLAKEEQLAQRAAAIKALRQERRDNFAQHGPRLTRKRAGQGQQEEVADGTNNTNNSSHSNSNKRRRSLRSSGPSSATTPPPSPLLNNNQQRQLQRMKTVTPMPGDLDGSSADEETRIGSGSGSGSDGSTVDDSDACRSTPGVESFSQQQQQREDGSVLARPTSRRKQQWRPCHAALQ